MNKIYLASSWRNNMQPAVLELLRENGQSVYDFRNPRSGGPPITEDTPEAGFDWRNCDPTYDPQYRGGEVVSKYRALLSSPPAQQGFNADFNAMKWADVCVLLLPCGRSAHLEAGWMTGQGKQLIVYMPTPTYVCYECDGDPVPQCRTCNGSGRVITWASAFEPELMYMIGGPPSIIVSTGVELLEALKP
jgi:hypothetical protein